MNASGLGRSVGPVGRQRALKIMAILFGCALVSMGLFNLAARRSDSSVFYLVCIIAAGPWLLCTMNFRTAKFFDGCRHLGQLLGEPASSFPDTPEVNAIAMTANLWWVGFPLSFVVTLAMVAVVLSSPVRADYQVWQVLALVPVLIVLVHQRNLAERLETYRLPG